MEKKEKVVKEKSKVKVIPAEKAAYGVRLPAGNPTLVAVANASTDELPANLLKLFVKIRAAGKAGVHVSTICGKGAAGKYARWLVRQLCKRSLIEATPEPKAEPKQKNPAKPKKTTATPKAATANNPAKVA
jgi:hypothetical protein